MYFYIHLLLAKNYELRVTSYDFLKGNSTEILGTNHSVHVRERDKFSSGAAVT